MCVRAMLPVCPTLPWPPCPHAHSLHLHLCSCPANKFISTIFLDATYMASLVAHLVKNPPAMQETQVLSLDQEDPLEKEIATCCSILAWRIPWTEEPGGLQSIGSHRVRHNWSDFTCTYTYSCYWRVWDYLRCSTWVTSLPSLSLLQFNTL